MSAPTHASLIAKYLATRARTEALVAPLSAEDQMLQSMPDCSPARWHRAHTTWFFETFILKPRAIAAHNAAWDPLFNSYYESVGPRHARAQRGLLSRPSVAEITEYRRVIDARIVDTIEATHSDGLPELDSVLMLGCAHEEQHQELLLTDILHALYQNPLLPAYHAASITTRAQADKSAAHLPLDFVPFDGGLVTIGVNTAADTPAAFVFDNETPEHRQWLNPYSISQRLVTVAEMGEFIRAQGYRTPSLWLSEGLAWVRANHIETPLYARYEAGAYCAFGFEGERVLGGDEPVLNLNYYEADAVARFFDARLPTEFELEYAAARTDLTGGFLTDALRPRKAVLAALPAGEIAQMWGDAWQWTRSSYEAYPGFAPTTDALGEYNGKFMVNQRVLRGGSYLTPPAHIRLTYRNFWPAHTSFQATGVRLARDR